MLSNAVAFRYNRKERRQIHVARKAELEARRKLGQIREILGIPGLAAPKEESAVKKLVHAKHELTRELFLDHVLTRGERKLKLRLLAAEEDTLATLEKEDALALQILDGSSMIISATHIAEGGLVDGEAFQSGIRSSSAPPSVAASDPRTDKSGAEGSNKDSDEVDSVASDLSDDFSEVSCGGKMGSVAAEAASTPASKQTASITTSRDAAAPNQPSLKVQREARSTVSEGFEEVNDLALLAFLASLGREDLVRPLTRAGIRSPMQLGKAGDAVLLGPSVGMKPEEVVNFRHALRGEQNGGIANLDSSPNSAMHVQRELISPAGAVDCSNSSVSSASSSASSSTSGASSITTVSEVIVSRVISTPREDFFAAVRRDWQAVQNAPTEEFLGDREIMLAALKQSDHALQYTSKELRDDIEYMMSAVVLSGGALRYASRALRRGKSFTEKAFLLHPLTIPIVSFTLLPFHFDRPGSSPSCCLSRWVHFTARI
jgi:hypothetical protein